MNAGANTHSHTFTHTYSHSYNTETQHNTQHSASRTHGLLAGLDGVAQVLDELAGEEPTQIDAVALDEQKQVAATRAVRENLSLRVSACGVCACVCMYLGSGV